MVPGTGLAEPGDTDIVKYGGRVGSPGRSSIDASGSTPLCLPGFNTPPPVPRSGFIQAIER